LKTEKSIYRGLWQYFSVQNKLSNSVKEIFGSDYSNFYKSEIGQRLQRFYYNAAIGKHLLKTGNTQTLNIIIALMVTLSYYEYINLVQQCVSIC
jgi:hypothetical protein